MRSELTPIIQRVQGMIDYVRENLDDQEYDLFCDLLVPEPVASTKPEKLKIKLKRLPRCYTCNYTKRHQIHKNVTRDDYHEFVKSPSSSKSTRAKSVSEAIQKVAKTKVDDIDNDEIFAGQCQFVVNDATGQTCDAVRDDPIHDLTYSSSHEFTSGKSHALAAGERL